MSLPLEPQPVPLYLSTEGAIRVNGTRISIGIIVSRFNGGWTPEVMVAKMPTLSLGDVYGVIAYYLRNQVAVDAYLVELDRQADELQAKIESAPGYQEGLYRIRARMAATSGQP